MGQSLGPYWGLGGPKCAELGIGVPRSGVVGEGGGCVYNGAMQVQIIRSSKRRKTVSARLEGDTLVVQAPEHISDAELTGVVAKLQSRVERNQVRRQQRSALTDADLQARAQALNTRFFEGRLRWQSIRWVTNQQRRFGSCTPSEGTIRISQRVATLPPWVQDYVLVHELAHLVEANHASRFWKLVNRYPLTERARGYLMALGLEEPEQPAASLAEGGI